MEILFHTVRLCHSVEIPEIYSHTFLQKFPESTVFSKELISQNIILVRGNYSVFHTMC